MTDHPSGADRIIDAAIDSFGERGVAGTTLQRIAQQAGVSQALIVHHFGSKRNLADRCTTAVLARVEESARTNPERAVEEFAARPSDVRYLARVLTDEEDASRALFAAAVERAAAARPDADADEAVVLATLNLAPLLLFERVSESLPDDTWGRFSRAAARLLAPNEGTGR